MYKKITTKPVFNILVDGNTGLGCTYSTACLYPLRSPAPSRNWGENPHPEHVLIPSSNLPQPSILSACHFLYPIMSLKRLAWEIYKEYVSLTAHMKTWNRTILDRCPSSATGTPYGSLFDFSCRTLPECIRPLGNLPRFIASSVSS